MDHANTLMTTIGLIEGEVLTYLEDHGSTTLDELALSLEWPCRFIWMAVGALTRQGLVHVTQHELDAIVETSGMPADWTESPEVWG